MEISCEPLTATVGFVSGNHRIPLVSQEVLNNRVLLHLAPRSQPVGQRIGIWNPVDSQGISMVTKGRQMVSHEERVPIGSLETPQSSISPGFYKGLPITEYFPVPVFFWPARNA